MPTSIQGALAALARVSAPSDTLRARVVFLMLQYSIVARGRSGVLRSAMETCGRLYTEGLVSGTLRALEPP